MVGIQRWEVPRWRPIGVGSSVASDIQWYQCQWLLVSSLIGMTYLYIYIPGYSLVTNFFPGQIRPKGRNLGNGHLFVSFRRSRYILSTVNVFDQRFGADTPNFYRTWRDKFSFTAFWSVEVSVLPDTVPMNEAAAVASVQDFRIHVHEKVWD